MYSSRICGWEAVRQTTFQPVKMANGGLSQCFSSTLADSFDSNFWLTYLSTLVDSVVAVTKHPYMPISKCSVNLIFSPHSWLLRFFLDIVQPVPPGHRADIASIVGISGSLPESATSLKHR